MGCFYVSIEKNVEVFDFYKALWNELGIDGIRVDTMTEGIEKAVEIEKSETDELFFIDIVADDINFLPQLKILSEETNAPILIATSNYTEDEHHDALNNGADFYALYCEKPEQNINGVLAVINSINQRGRKRKSPNKIISHGDILIVIEYNKVFIEDIEIVLTASEMKIFQYMMINRGHILSHKQLYSQINGGFHGEYDLTPDVIYGLMKRLRKNLRKATRFEYIETVKEIGYRLKTKTDIKNKYFNKSK